jgi:hypothetical protein
VNGKHEFDIFIAYASGDAEYARRLYEVLTAVGHRVFRDVEALRAGDEWGKTVERAHGSSLLTVVLLSSRSTAAFFQREEILNAVERARQGLHRVVPVYLTTRADAQRLPSPLKQLQGIFWEEGSSLLLIAQAIEAALLTSKRELVRVREVDAATIVLITGCHYLPELFDRPCAYELQASIEAIGRDVHRAFLRAITMGDIWFHDHSNIREHPHVISVGSDAFNLITRSIVQGGQVVRTDPTGKWQVVRNKNRWALFGHEAEDTYSAVESFTNRDLPAFLESVWR